MTAKEFLQSEGLLDKDKNEFIIKFEDGREFDLVTLLKQYADIYYSDCERQKNANEENFS